MGRICRHWSPLNFILSVGCFLPSHLIAWCGKISWNFSPILADVLNFARRKLIWFYIWICILLKFGKEHGTVQTDLSSLRSKEFELMWRALWIFILVPRNFVVCHLVVCLLLWFAFHELSNCLLLNLKHFIFLHFAAKKCV